MQPCINLTQQPEGFLDDSNNIIQKDGIFYLL